MLYFTNQLLNASSVYAQHQVNYVGLGTYWHLTQLFKYDE